MKVLITGASGFIGRYLCNQCLQQGYSVTAAVRVADAQKYDFEQVIVESVDGNTNWFEVLSEVDVVVHLAARVHVMSDKLTDPLAEFRKVNVDGTRNLAKQASQAKVRRFIFMSSVKVNGESTEFGKPFSEQNTANPQDAYGLSKFEAEQSLLQVAQQTGMEILIIRPPLVYGAGVKANFASMMRAVKRGIPLPFGAIHNERSFVYVGNLVSLIMWCLEHPAAANQVLLVSDGHDLSTTGLLRESAKALGVKARLVPIPQKLIELTAAVTGKKKIAQRLCSNLQVDISKARTLLGWKPPFTVEQGLKATADSFR